MSLPTKTDLIVEPGDNFRYSKLINYIAAWAAKQVLYINKFDLISKKAEQNMHIFHSASSGMA
jgi:hypothetical protein